MFSGVSRLLTPFVTFNKQMEKENEIYIKQLKDLIQYFSSIEDNGVREFVVEFVEKIMTEEKKSLLQQ
jgi:hypothetical protein